MIAGTGLIVFSLFFGIQKINGLGANINQILNQANSPNPQTENNNSAGNVPAKSDIDKDGLPDDEEAVYGTDPLKSDTDGDGFLDGEEAAAGCSPISASPKDCDLKLDSGQANINLTDYFSSLILGGVLSNDLNETNPKFNEYITNLQNEALNIQRTLLSIDEAELKIETNEDNSKKSSQEYLNSFENILKNHFLKQSEPNLGETDFAGFDYSPYLEDAKTTYEELANLKPTQSWSELHEKSLKFFFELKTYFSNLDNQKGDPLKALLTLKNTDRLLDDYENLIKEISGKVKNENLKTGIFNL